MAVAQRVAEEVLATCQHNTLLALRRWVLPTTPIRSSRKLELIADIATACDTWAIRKRIFPDVLVKWSVLELRLFTARMRGLGYMGPVGQKPKKRCLIAAIVRAGVRAVTTDTASRATRPQRLRRPRVSSRASVLHGIGSIGFGSRPSQAPAEVVQALAQEMGETANRS